MRWAARITIGLAAALATSLSGPLWVEAAWAYGQRIPGYFDLIFLAVYTIPLFLIAGVIAWLFLRLGLAPRRHEIATRLALGQTRSTMVSQAARSGLRSGAIAAAVAAVASAIVSQFTYDESEAPWTGVLSQTTLVAYVGVAVIATATSVLVHVLAMAAVTRGTPDAADAVVAADDDVPGERPGWVRGARLAWWGAYLLGLGVAAVNRFVPLDPWAIETLANPGWLMVTKNIAMTIAIVGTLWVAGAMARRIAERLVRGSALLLGRGGAAGAGSIAADGLARRSATRTRVVTLAAIVSGLVALSLAGLGHSQAIDAATREASADGYLFSVDVFGAQTQPAGFATQALDAEALAALEADPRVDVVPFSLLFDEPYEYTSCYAETCSTGTEQEVLLAVDAEAMDTVAPSALRTLGLMDGVILSGTHWQTDPEGFPAEEGATIEFTYSEATDETPVYRIGTSLELDQTAREWAAETWGPAPTSGAMLFPAAGQPAGMDVFTVADEYFPPSTVWSLDPDSGESFTTFDGVGVALAVIGLGVGVVMIVSTTATSVRMRRRELATFAALGARPADLRAAPVWEATVLAGASAVAGAVVGVIVSVTTTNVFLLEAGAPFDLTEILWHLGADLAAVPWVWMLVVATGTVAAAVVAAATFSRSMSARSPVDELRTADREGVR
ncbi:FtsX-like permease family protein [Demequina activiva]|uniref:ABC3 transporter permease C-terminal domain-containing protein n=1 Tax=Demequina activiva TaxID=1582364 RepID=A0A919Q123_9MICO|nr:ABC transporter permease [Demequina activiva]GIG53956.1 hypothetical protein Dac01nite_07080 [Demequina activiva]